MLTLTCVLCPSVRQTDSRALFVGAWASEVFLLYCSACFSNSLTLRGNLRGKVEFKVQGKVRFLNIVVLIVLSTEAIQNATEGGLNGLQAGSQDRVQMWEFIWWEMDVDNTLTSLGLHVFGIFPNDYTSFTFSVYCTSLQCYCCKEYYSHI